MFAEKLFTAWSDPSPERPVCLAIGVFDGVHRGHQALLRTARLRAQHLGIEVVALTFDPHPRALLLGDEAVSLLMPVPERVAHLRLHGADRVLGIDFTPHVADLDGHHFVGLLCEALSPALVCVGSDFRFGRDRSGDVEALRLESAARGFEVVSMPQLLDGGQRISSTRVRELLAGGELRAAESLLGRAAEPHRAFA
jgi:riboflavin kinase / FMN adenylyltransferase